MSETANLRQTPLNAVHRALGARMVDFGGWDMPVQYSGILDEHHAVRTRRRTVRCQPHGRDRDPRAGGARPGQLRLHQRRREARRRARRSIPGCSTSTAASSTTSWSTRWPTTHYFLCVNASNQDKDFEHIAAHEPLELHGGVRRRALRADRGAGSARRSATLQKLTADRSGRHPVLPVRRRRGERARRRASRAPATRARTASRSTSRRNWPKRVWDELMEAGAEFGIKPCGLGARNTLRLEAAMALYGHEIDASISPLEAGPRLDREVGQGRFRGPRGAGEAEGRRASRAS